MPVAVNAKWETTNSGELLTTEPDLATYESNEALLQPEKRSALWNLWRLSPDQVQRLLSKRVLSPTELNAEQRKAFKTLALYALVTRGSAIAPEVLDLKGCYITLDTAGGVTGAHVTVRGENGVQPPQDQNAIKATVTLVLRRLDGDPEPSYLLFPSNIPGDAARQAQTIPYQVPYFPPDRLPMDPVKTPEPADLSRDANLVSPMSLGPRSTVMAGLLAIARTRKVDILAATRFHYYPLKTSSPSSNIRTIMETVASISGGYWCRKGPVYVLDPDPLCERAAALKPVFRQQWMSLGFDEAMRGLTNDQRSKLAGQGKLAAGDLSQSQRVALRWVLACAFVQGRSPHVSEIEFGAVELVPGERHHLRLVVTVPNHAPIEVIERESE